MQAYNQSAATMNLLRAFSTGGYAGLDRVAQWNLEFMGNSKEGAKYLDLAGRVDESIQFMKVRKPCWHCRTARPPFCLGSMPQTAVVRSMTVRK